MSPCQPIAPLGRPSEGGLTGSPDAGRCSAGAAPSSPSRRRRRRVISSARLSAPSRRPLRRGTGRHCPPDRRARGRRRREPGRFQSTGPSNVMTVACTCRKQPDGPLSFTVPSCGAAQGRLPERPKGAVCKTVGFAFPGSNPGPATTCGNGPWPGVSPGSRAAALGLVGPAESMGVRLFPAVHGRIADSVPGSRLWLDATAAPLPGPGPDRLTGKPVRSGGRAACGRWRVGSSRCYGGR